MNEKFIGSTLNDELVIYIDFFNKESQTLCFLPYLSQTIKYER